MIDTRFTQSESTMRHALRSQIPSFYNDEGPNFVLFIEKYFQHLETDVLSVGRNLQNTGDIDETADDFLLNFNNKYTFGQGQSIRTLPAVVTGDLRFIIKHIKDIYRSKGTDRGLKLFFRVAFNDSPEIFTPGTQLFRASDSTFKRPDILEIDDGEAGIEALRSLPGTNIEGNVSGARATVDNFFIKRVGEKTFNYIGINNITGNFVTGDKITVRSPSAEQLSIAPGVTGPVNGLNIIDGGIGIPAGTVFTSDDDRGLKVSATEFEFLSGTFDISPVTGSKYSNESDVIITRAPGESVNIERGQFSVATNGSEGLQRLNGSIIASVSAQTINSTVMFGSPLTLSDSIDTAETFSERLYGDITSIPAGTFPQFYTKRPFVRVEDITFSGIQQGTVDVSSTTVTGTGTTFDDLVIDQPSATGTANVTFGSSTVYGVGTSFLSEFDVNDVMRVNNSGSQYLTIVSIKSDTELEVMESPDFTALGATFSQSHKTYIKLIDSLGNEFVRVVNNAVSNTSLFLDDIILDSDPLTESTGLTYRMGYASEKSIDVSTAGNFGRDASFIIDVVAGDGSVKDVYIMNAGFGFGERENIVMISEDLTPEISFSNSNGSGATGYVTIENEEIVAVTLTSGGSGYDTVPVVTLEGGTGSGATFTATVSNGTVSSVTVTSGGAGYRTRAQITARPIKGGQSILEGQTIRLASETSRGLRIQDSDFWQEYSYEIRSSIDGTKYEEVVDGLLHMAGRKLFTRPSIRSVNEQNITVLTDSVTAD